MTQPVGSDGEDKDKACTHDRNKETETLKCFGIGTKRHKVCLLAVLKHVNTARESSAPGNLLQRGDVEIQFYHTSWRCHLEM